MDNLDVENIPLVNLLNDLFTEYSQALRTLLSLLDTDTNKNTTQEATKQRESACHRIVKLDKDLQTIYGEIVKHQLRQEEIRKTQLRSIESGKAKLHFIDSMLDAKGQLELIIADADKRLAVAKRAETARPEVEEVIEYAKKLSAFTSAPPNYDPNSSIVPAEPPYPVEVAIRMGVLNQYRSKKTKKAEREMEVDAGEDEFVENAEEFQFGDLEASDLLLGLDLNPDLE
ncbi:hypothetical protein GQ54DRAFT_283449 [Martensiomyces pterosporus]|nr:hypothetical protein GQ54DRAFT_283449 [Martensiomyces pterosporus]